MKSLLLPTACLLALSCSAASEPPPRPDTNEPFWWGAATSPYQVEDPGDDVFVTDWDLFFERGRLLDARGEGVHSWSEMPTTSYPRSFSSAAATELSTPPLIATTIFSLISVIYKIFFKK